MPYRKLYDVPTSLCWFFLCKLIDSDEINLKIDVFPVQVRVLPKEFVWLIPYKFKMLLLENQAVLFGSRTLNDWEGGKGRIYFYDYF